MPPVGFRQQVKGALPGTYAEIMEKAHVSHTTAKRWLKELRDAGECHIGKWKRSLDTRGHYQPVWVAGPGKDVRCTLKPMTSAQASARYRRKHRDDEKGDRMRARDRTRHFTERARTVGDPLVRALFGAAHRNA
jgi:hypothetical protein